MEHILNLLGHDLKLDDIVRAENCTLTDRKGNNYLDLESGVWSTAIGHSNPAVADVIAESAKTFMHSGYCYNSMEVDSAAKKLLEIAGFEKGKCVFLCSGSEAVDLAITVSMHIMKRKKILTLSDSYISAFGHSANENEIIRYDWLDKNATNHVDYDQVSAFLFEPGSSSGLVRFPPKHCIDEIVRKVQEAGGLVIANEVTTGIGRTGSWFGYNHYGITPDMVAVAKGLGNGYPVSCVLFSAKTVSGIDLSRFHYGQSHQNDPLGAKVALCVIREIENNDLITRANRIGAIIRTGLDEIKKKYGIIKDIRNRGLMFALEFFPVTHRSISQEIADYLFDNNIILVKRPNNEVLRFDPALTIEESDVEMFLDCFDKAVNYIRRNDGCYS